MTFKRNQIGPANAFSFVEVMVAMVILSLSLIILMDSQTRSMDTVARAKSVDVATSLAQAKMVELIQETREKDVTILRDEETGEFDQGKYPGFKWKYWKKNVPAPDFGALAGGGGEQEGQGSNKDMLAGPLQAISKVWGNALKELHVEVSWGEGRNLRSFELVTHLIAADTLTQLQALMSSMRAGGGSQ